MRLHTNGEFFFPDATIRFFFCSFDWFSLNFFINLGSCIRNDNYLNDSRHFQQIISVSWSFSNFNLVLHDTICYFHKITRVFHVNFTFSRRKIPKEIDEKLFLIKEFRIMFGENFQKCWWKIMQFSWNSTHDTVLQIKNTVIIREVLVKLLYFLTRTYKSLFLEIQLNLREFLEENCTLVCVTKCVLGGIFHNECENLEKIKPLYQPLWYFKGDHI